MRKKLDKFSCTCRGEKHNIVFGKNGHIGFESHSLEELRAEWVMLALGDETVKECTCAKVLDMWSDRKRRREWHENQMLKNLGLWTRYNKGLKKGNRRWPDGLDELTIPLIPRIANKAANMIRAAVEFCEYHSSISAMFRNEDLKVNHSAVVHAACTSKPATTKITHGTVLFDPVQYLLSVKTFGPVLWDKGCEKRVAFFGPSRRLRHDKLRMQNGERFVLAMKYGRGHSVELCRCVVRKMDVLYKEGELQWAVRKWLRD